MSSEVHSFDVFDTLITRAVGRPRSLFLLLGSDQTVGRITGCSPNEFARLRIEAEERARRDRAEVTLPDIYAELGAGLGLSSADQSTIAALEVALEHRLTRAIPGARERLAASTGVRRVAVSDMYLGPVVHELLERHGLADLLDDVLVSSEAHATKASGDLFQLLVSTTAQPPALHHHVGDNLHADGRVPRLLGLSTQVVAPAALNRYEHAWESRADATGGMSSLIAGASRLTRLATSCGPDEQPVVDVAAGVAAPLMTAYMLWVLRCANRDGIRRLYFLARDGEILYLVAQRLRERLGLDVELHYLYGSRNVFHRAALATAPLESAAWAWRAMYPLTPVAVLERLGMSRDVASTHVARLGLDPQGRVDEGLAAQLVQDPSVREGARRLGSDLLARVQEYLQQEGVGVDGDYGIVDTGWTGRTVRALTATLPAVAVPPRRAFFFGYMRRHDGFVDTDLFRGYLFDEVAGTGFRGEFDRIYGPIETFTAADHGMTVDFQRTADRIEPVLASPCNPALTGWPWRLYRETVLRFVDELVLEADVAHVGADLRAGVATVLHEFWSRPTRAEAAAWGTFVYEDDVLGDSRHTLARGWTAREFASKVTDTSYTGRQLWLGGAVALTSRPLRPLARVGLWAAERRRTAGGWIGLVPDKQANRLRLLRLAWQVRHPGASGGRGRGRASAVSAPVVPAQAPDGSSDSVRDAELAPTP